MARLEAARNERNRTSWHARERPGAEQREKQKQARSATELLRTAILLFLQGLQATADAPGIHVARRDAPELLRTDVLRLLHAGLHAVLRVNDEAVIQRVIA